MPCKRTMQPPDDTLDSTDLESDPHLRPCVLVALADVEERELARGWLAEGYHVETACDGLEALSHTCTHLPSALLIEPELPNASGYSVIRALRSAGVFTPVLVAVQHRARAVDRIRPLILGATDAISKPLNRFELCHRIQSMVQLGRGERLPELREAELLFLAETNSHVVAPQSFLEQCGRALRIGTRFGFESTLVSLETRSTGTLEAASDVAEKALRIEDSFCIVGPHRGVVLLIGSRPREARTVVRRLHADLVQHVQKAETSHTEAPHPPETPEPEPLDLGWYAHPLAQAYELLSARLEPDWEELFQDLQWMRPARVGSLRHRLRLLRGS